MIANDITFETTGAGNKKMKISANPDNFITKMILAIQSKNKYPNFAVLFTYKKV